MTEEKLRQDVDDVIAGSGDPEGAHGAEDQIHLDIIREFCPAWVVEQVNRLDEADFPRWRA